MFRVVLGIIGLIVKNMDKILVFEMFLVGRMLGECDFSVSVRGVRRM